MKEGKKSSWCNDVVENDEGGVVIVLEKMSYGYEYVEEGVEK